MLGSVSKAAELGDDIVVGLGGDGGGGIVGGLLLWKV